MDYCVQVKTGSGLALCSATVIIKVDGFLIRFLYSCGYMALHYMSVWLQKSVWWLEPL